MLYILGEMPIEKKKILFTITQIPEPHPISRIDTPLLKSKAFSTLGNKLLL